MKHCLLPTLHQQHDAVHSFAVVLDVTSMMLLLLSLLSVDAAGYSYTRFVGPVTGPEHKIYVSDANSANHGSGTLRLDYVGKPEYEFAYGVEDANAHILHNRNEVRNGDAVKGVYSLIDPDGSLRVVKYTADGMNGFQAEVIRNGVSSVHGQPQHDFSRSPPSKIISLKHNNAYTPNHEHQQHAHSPIHLKEDRNVYHPAYNQHQTPPQLPKIYHYSKNYDDNEDDRGGSNENHNAFYEVHEKSNDNDNHDDHYAEDDNGHKSNNYLNVNGHKKENLHSDEDDEDSYEEKDSEELEDYDEDIHNNQKSEEVEDYY